MSNHQLPGYYFASSGLNFVGDAAEKADDAGCSENFKQYSLSSIKQERMVNAMFCWVFDLNYAAGIVLAYTNLLLKCMYYSIISRLRSFDSTLNDCTISSSESFASLNIKADSFPKISLTHDQTSTPNSNTNTNTNTNTNAQTSVPSLEPKNYGYGPDTPSSKFQHEYNSPLKQRRKKDIIDMYTNQNSSYRGYGLHDSGPSFDRLVHFQKKFSDGPSINSLHGSTRFNHNSSVSNLHSDFNTGLDVDLVKLQIKEAIKIKPENTIVRTPVFDSFLRRDLELKKKIESQLKKESGTKFQLPPDIDMIIKKAFATNRVCKLNNVTVEPRDLKTLLDGNWLNDEIINYYMELIMNQDKDKSKAKAKAKGKGKDSDNDKDGLSTVFCFNTFFLSTLEKSGYARVKRWTKKVNLFEKDMVIAPVHLGNHWCTAIIYVKKKRILYLDSLLGNNDRCLSALLEYISNESETKLGTPINRTEWTLEAKKDIPRQKNGYDCGVFTCIFAEYASRNAEFTFGQEDMKYYRKKLMFEILTNKIY